MKGNIHGIWFTKKDGMLHPAILPNLASMVAIAKSHNFNIVFWTNFNEVKPTEVENLQDAGIIVKDHAECQTSRFYRHFMSFLERGIAGDIAAFALASDIFRVAILELASNDEYYIYADPNDIFFPTLNENLTGLDAAIKKTAWGFSFVIEVLLTQYVHMRNGLLIALKNLNRPFFDAYLTAYEKNLHDTADSYFTTNNWEEIQKFAIQIVNQATFKFFSATADSPIVKANFGEFTDYYPDLNFANIFPYVRKLEYANTWLPEGSALASAEKLFESIKIDFITKQNELKTKYGFKPNPIETLENGA